MQPNEFSSKNRATPAGSEFAASMAVAVADQLRKRGIKEHEADEIAVEVLNEVRFQFGGQTVYFPLEDKAMKSALHEEIYSKYENSQMGVAELAKEYGFSVAWVYQIIRTIRLKRREELDEAKVKTRKNSIERWKRES
ncbi:MULTISPECIES: Mor transcription activator family protein [Pseudomonas]|uniref:Mor transcription activator family protein n=1 Tax=Pseudomonas TaxID=286 RepID=UPI001C3048B6|nr:MULTISPECIES: Mor transcription activator family protein [Pseudomonas]MBV2081958.1 hypothetical protein [Pseudomonas carnis]MBV2087843.1 hypothetical protein [Pseudomonas carnis]MDO3691756.1 Mor transcription activator family protein [Pseudomonas sp. DKN 2791]MDO7033475.1 Mor transcription activator family protein [Pseudomonas sp. DKN 2792]